jgi:hypothetical protein
MLNNVKKTFSKAYSNEHQTKKTCRQPIEAALWPSTGNGHLQLSRKISFYTQSRIPRLKHLLNGACG